MLDVVLLVIGCAALYTGGELLIRGASAVGRRLSMSPLVVGLLLVGLGTSAPELAVSLDAALQNHPELAVGNVVGSNIVNATLGMLALWWLVSAATIQSLILRDGPILVGLTLLGALFLRDASVSRVEGLVLLLSAAAFFVAVLGNRRHVRPTRRTRTRRTPLLVPLMLIGGGVVLLVAGAEAMVRSGVGIALALGVPEAVVAMTVTALGTGVPEITATLVAVLRGQPALALGNVVGSNILNLGLVLGLTALVTPLRPAAIDAGALLLMVGSSLLLWLAMAHQGRHDLGWSND